MASRTLPRVSFSARAAPSRLTPAFNITRAMATLPPACSAFRAVSRVTPSTGVDSDHNVVRARFALVDLVTTQGPRVLADLSGCRQRLGTARDDELNRSRVGIERRRGLGGI